jgi:diguanylate cyclase (GGDEF)-like protein
MDGLTGFFDRKECAREMERLAEEARAQGTSVCVLWIGIDRFRQINASFGHEAGDNVLAKLAYRLHTQGGIGNLLGRIGGDEFVALLPVCDLAAGEGAADRVLHVLRAPLEIGEVRLRPSCSIGLALLEADESPLNALERADRAMLDAKRAGGSRYVISGDERVTSRFGNLLAREELAIEELLHEALEDGGLSLSYQPIISSTNKRLEALEALMRCRVRDRQIPPAQFIPVAEKTGLIVRLGEWTLLSAARLAERLAAEGTPTKIAVNVSRAQLTAPKFQQVLHGVLACCDIQPAYLELELTESLFMDTSAMVRNNLFAAVDAGFPLAIDDFGTGYSCLAYLKDLPAQKLKLDRAFIMGLPEDKKSFAIVRTVTQLALDFGMTVVAEGVETEQQRDALLEAGVNALQGFLFSRPLEEHLLDAWLAGTQGA